MILFKEDWFKEKNKNAIVHWSTKNESFVKVVAQLERLGVENRFFILALINPELEHVDPYDPDLTEEQKAAILIECKINPWYFFRECVRFTPSGSSKPIMFKASRLNISVLFCFFTHVTSMSLAPRQVGKTFGPCVLCAYLLDLGANNTNIILLTKDDSLRTKTLMDIKNIFEDLPPYLNFKLPRKDVCNTEEIGVSCFRNRLTAKVGQASEKDADKLGRGFTSPIVWTDEMAFVNNINVTAPALAAATNAAIESAKAAGSHYGFIYTTTAGFLSSKEGKYAKNFYDTSLPWTEKLLDCKDIDDLHETIVKNNKSRLDEQNSNIKLIPKRVVIEYNHRQLGFSDSWIREKISEADGDSERINADYFCIWGKNNANSPITEKTADILYNNLERDPLTMKTPEGYLLRWYVDKQTLDNNCSNMKIVVAIDPSEANGKDDIGMVGMDALTGRVVCVGNYNETNVIQFGVWLANLLVRFPTMVLLVERRSMGTAIIDTIITVLRSKNIDPFKRLFNWVVNDYMEKPNYKDMLKISHHYRDEVFYNRIKTEFGFATSGTGRTSREIIYGRIFGSAIKYLPHLVLDKTLVEQLTSLVYRNGRIDHPIGGHDDLVICWLLCFWFLTNANNKDFYGINTTDVLQNMKKQQIEEEGGVEAIKEKTLQENLKSMLGTLKERIMQEKDPNMLNMLIGRWEYLSRQLKEDTMEVINVDELKENLRNKKFLSKNI